MFNIYDQRLKERLLRELNLTLEKIVDMCRAAKTQIQAKGEQNKTVHAIKKKTANTKHNNRYERTSTQQQKANVGTFNCKKCSKSHLPRQCPAFSATCQACGKHNHFASVCRLENKDTQTKQKRNVTVHRISKTKEDHRLRKHCTQYSHGQKF